ncbi:MAG: hypothetical protein MRZ59_01760 [Clostridiales bacterium]|nr:hypothetical protein [Clostridiales bacterium]MDY3745501.1 hypothetical protein [Lachnospiraceae bacterium]
MKMKKFLCLMAAFAMTAAVLTGCGAQTAGSEEKENEKEIGEKNGEENGKEK